MQINATACEDAHLQTPTAPHVVQGSLTWCFLNVVQGFLTWYFLNVVQDWRRFKRMGAP